MILRNHGLLTVGTLRGRRGVVVHHDGALLPGAAARRGGGHAHPHPRGHAALTKSQVGEGVSGYFNSKPLYDKILRVQPDLLD